MVTAIGQAKRRDTRERQITGVQNHFNSYSWGRDSKSGNTRVSLELQVYVGHWWSLALNMVTLHNSLHTHSKIV